MYIIDTFVQVDKLVANPPRRIVSGDCQIDVDMEGPKSVVTTSEFSLSWRLVLNTH